MPRRARLALAGVPVHVIQRGNNRSACFFADEDYVLYLHHLSELAPKFGCHIHAYVLMTNHVHLLLTPKTATGASSLMKHLGQRYVQYVNRTYRRSGTLWEGRFRSCLAREERYVLACHRYIEMNPVRAEMVKHPRYYKWSSYRVNAEGLPSNLISAHTHYLALGNTAQQRQEAYKALFRTDVDEEILRQIREATNGNYALGSTRFQAQVEETLGRRAIRGEAGRPRSQSDALTRGLFGSE